MLNFLECRRRHPYASAEVFCGAPASASCQTCDLQSHCTESSVVLVTGPQTADREECVCQDSCSSFRRIVSKRQPSQPGFKHKVDMKKTDMHQEGTQGA